MMSQFTDLQTNNITSASQSEQSHGYWLIELSFDEALPLSQALESDFFITRYPQIELAYFQAKAKGETHQFLSAQPLPDALLNTTFKLTRSVNPLAQAGTKKTALPVWLVASGLSMAKVFAYVQAYKNTREIRVLLHSTSQFPFVIKPARFLMSTAPAEAIGASTLLEDWGVPNRLAADEFLAGTWQGSLADFLAHNLNLYAQQNTPPEPHTLLVFANPEQTQACYRISQAYSWLHH